MTEQEKQELLAAQEAEDAADDLLAESAIMSAVSDFDNDEKKKLVSSMVRESTEMSDEEKAQAVDKFMAEMAEMEEKYENQKDYSASVLSAKLAARKRMRDAKLKEEAMKKELDALSAKQVWMLSFPRRFLPFLHNTFGLTVIPDCTFLKRFHLLI